MYVMHLLALLWLTNSVHIYQASITLLFYVFPVSWYWVCSCTQGGTYDLLHTGTKILYSILFYHSYICSIRKNILFLFLRLQISDSETMLIDMNFCTLAYELFILCQRNTSGLSKPFFYHDNWQPKYHKNDLVAIANQKSQLFSRSNDVNCSITWSQYAGKEKIYSAGAGFGKWIQQSGNKEA